MPYKNKYCINDLQGRRKYCNLGCQKYRKDSETFTIYFQSNHLKEITSHWVSLLVSPSPPLVHLLLILGYYVFFPYSSPDNLMQHLLPKVTGDLKEEAQGGLLGSIRRKIWPLTRASQ